MTKIVEYRDIPLDDLVIGSNYSPDLVSRVKDS